MIGEAMACGTPVAATDVGDVRLITGELGEVVPPRNPDLLCAAWQRLRRRLAEDPRLRNDVRGRIVANYSLDTMVRRTEDALGQLNRTDIQKVSDWTFRDLNAKYPGLHGYAATYRVISNTRQKNRSYQITSAVRQDIEIASIPLCQFQYFYVPDLELHPSSGGMRNRCLTGRSGSFECAKKCRRLAGATLRC